MRKGSTLKVRTTHPNELAWTQPKDPDPEEEAKRLLSLGAAAVAFTAATGFDPSCFDAVAQLQH